MPKSTYLAGKMLGEPLGATNYTAPANVYVALFTTDPTVAGSGTEVSGGNYSRVIVANNTTNWPATNPTANAATISFPTPNATWGTVTHWAIFDASSSGNMMYFAALTTSKTINSGDTVSFAASALSITES